MKNVSEREFVGWRFICEECGTHGDVEFDDLEFDKFKVSGYWFDGSAVTADHIFVKCPACDNIQFVDDRVPANIAKRIRNNDR